MRIALGAVISITPFSAGMAWNWMHLAVGLRRLGHEVTYLEQVEPYWCVDAEGKPCQLRDSINHELFATIMTRFNFEGRACQYAAGSTTTAGLSWDGLKDALRGADLLINMAGHVSCDELLALVRRRAYVDQDPVYTQLWRSEYGKDLGLSRHDAFLTVGLNIGTPHSHIPDCGIRWRPVLPPVVLDYWPFEVDESHRALTTVASWSGFRRLCYRDEWYFSKYEEFKRFVALPRESGQEMEVALRRYKDDDPGITMMRSNGWRILDASEIAEMSAYQRYIARSRGEIGIAKNAYVKGSSGWFSDRAAHYLACGRPVLAQSTGFERVLPTGQGLLTFRTMEEAVAGIRQINGDYAGHCRAARRFAEEFLEYDKSLPSWLAACMSEG